MDPPRSAKRIAWLRSHLPNVAAKATNSTRPPSDVSIRLGSNPSWAMPANPARISHPTESIVMLTAKVTWPKLRRSIPRSCSILATTGNAATDRASAMKAAYSPLP